MNDAEKLTVLAHLLRSVLVADGEPVTLHDRLVEVVGWDRLDEVLSGIEPLSSPPYSAEALDRMLGRQSPPSAQEGDQ